MNSSSAVRRMKCTLPNTPSTKVWKYSTFQIKLDGVSNAASWWVNAVTLRIVAPSRAKRVTVGDS